MDEDGCPRCERVVADPPDGGIPGSPGLLTAAGALSLLLGILSLAGALLAEHYVDIDPVVIPAKRIESLHARVLEEAPRDGASHEVVDLLDAQNDRVAALGRLLERDIQLAIVVAFFHIPLGLLMLVSARRWRRAIAATPPAPAPRG